MWLIRVLAILNTLAAAGFAVGLSSLSGTSEGPDPLQIASLSKTVPNSTGFALDIVSQYALHLERRAAVYRRVCDGLLAVTIVNAVAFAAMTQWRPPSR